MYFNICKISYSQYLNLEIDYQNTRREDERHDISSEADEYAVKSIVFAALCAEACINDYGAWQLEDKYYEAHLKNLDVSLSL